LKWYQLGELPGMGQLPTELVVFLPYAYSTWQQLLCFR